MSQEEPQQAKKRVSLRTNILNYFHEYCNCTSIHGFRYFGEQRTLFEKIWWIVFFGLCFTGLAFSITFVYKKWDDSPVIVTFATKPVPISNIPFPAITICSESKLKANTYNFSELLDKNKLGLNLTANETKVLNYMANVCDISSSQFRNLKPLDFIDILEEITPHYFPMNCVELGMKQHCEDLFTPLVTDDGLCYTFNILDRQEIFNEKVVHYKDFQVAPQSGANWNTETGYSEDAGVDTYPRRALLSGGRYAFTFDLVTIKNEIFLDCKDAVEGYKASFNLPARLPRVTQRYFRIPLDNIVAATIRPSVINTSTTVKQYPPAKRECYFPAEKKLRNPFLKKCSYLQNRQQQNRLKFGVVGQGDENSNSKLWWITFFSVCLTGLVFSIVAVYKKWDVSPVIVTFATKPVPILNIPFPAVTLCSESKLNAKTYNFSDLLDKNLQDKKLSSEEIKILNYMSNVCDINKDQFSELESTYFLDIIEQITPNFYPINCFDFGQSVRCKNYFTPLLTDDGLCYTFNILDRTDLFKENVVHFENFHLVNESAANWSSETGYSRKAGIGSYPRRALLHGGRYAFSFDLVTVKNEIFAECKDAVEGYKVSLHSPDRMPRLTQRYFRVPLNSIVAATIRPSMINTSATVKNYPPARRECYFPSERSLLYFKSYTQTNCNIECLANFTNDMCDCVHFSMPRENGTDICGGRYQKCMLQAERLVQMGRVLQNVDSQEFEIDEELKAIFQQIGCDCLPLCSHIDYNVGVSQTYWNWTRRRGAIRNLNENDYYLSKVSIFFLSGDFIPSERNELYGPLDFLANIGGLLGLFTGFSILSLIEIIYFLSLRLICNIQIYGHWWTQRE